MTDVAQEGPTCNTVHMISLLQKMRGSLVILLKKNKWVCFILAQYYTVPADNSNNRNIFGKNIMVTADIIKAKSQGQSKPVVCSQCSVK